MLKIIFIIIAMIVDQLAAAQDQRDLRSKNIFKPVVIEGDIGFSTNNFVFSSGCSTVLTQLSE